MSAHHVSPLYAPLHLAPKRSRCLLSYVLILHALALTAILISRLPGSATALLGAMVALSLARALLRHFRSPSGQASVSAVWEADDRWQVEYQDGRDRPQRRWDAPLIHPRLVMLRFWQGRFRFRCLCLCPDSIDAEVLRRLRVRLRRHAVSRQAGQTPD
jgi:toxin CptA